MWLAFLVVYTIGVVIGLVISEINKKRKAIGFLRVDNSDPDDGPYLFLEISQPPSTLLDKDHVVLVVKKENFVSRQ